jgi:hypothetical protein
MTAVNPRISFTRAGGLPLVVGGKAAIMTDSIDAYDAALPTYALLARFQVAGGTEAEAMAAVSSRLRAADMPFDQVSLEREESDGSWMVVARFVEPSLDAHTAAAGLHETLTSAGLAPDEVWVNAALA